MSTDFICEQRLREQSPQLHQLFKDSVFCMQRLLIKYQNIFPTYTDHTALHSLEVINFCNALIGEKNIKKMNADEIYILLMSSYLHDSGMGITISDYETFRQNIDFGNYFETHENPELADIIRDFHHEFSGEYIKNMLLFLIYRLMSILLQSFRSHAVIAKPICLTSMNIPLISECLTGMLSVCLILRRLSVLLTSLTLLRTVTFSSCMI